MKKDLDIITEKCRRAMFDSLMRPILVYSADIWERKEQDTLESPHEKYLRWVLVRGQLKIRGRYDNPILRESAGQK